MSFFEKKAKGFYFELVSGVCMLLALIFFGCLLGNTSETTDKTVLVLTTGILSIICCLVCLYKDYFKALSLGTFVLSTVALISFVAGRVSYVAFYLSGDVMGTGLSVWFVLTLVFMLLGFVASIVGMILRQEKQN